ncbi:hypothetical protein BKA56DRAFT_576123 [Ilyonectria sp. MPI-CAGE-AT-0026]|nr:hypothetical protein BKA56DRAFT_576123 [Ilyonectria sp. MPI-CAGE-AT-0026]
METVLVVGATGNIGVAAVKGALNSKRNVLAVVRNQNSADKLVKHIGSSEGITFVEANVLSDTGIQGVVAQVRAGKLPDFQHVYSCVGGAYVMTPLQEITTEQLRLGINSFIESNFFAYRDTIGYLLEKNHPESTWTLITGAQGDFATHAVPAIGQGALFALAVAASRENLETNVRFNEVYLGYMVQVDENAAKLGSVSSSEFATVYEKLLASPEIRSSRVFQKSAEDMKKLRYERRF